MGHESHLREFLYVDVQRTRSLLAQLGGGVVEQVKALRGDSVEAQAQARFLGIGAKGGYTHDWSSEEARSLQDMTFAMFEDEADILNLIRDLSGSVFDPAAWASGEVHSSLEPGELVRIRCDLRILDGELFRSRMKRFLAMGDALVAMNPPTVKGPSGNRQREDAIKRQKQELMGGTSDSFITATADFVEAFLGDSISLRVLPCGAQNEEYAFSGALLGRREYIQEEREHLFSRYGTYLRDWVCVLQIAAVPSEGDRVSSVSDSELVMSSGDVSRAATERIATELLSTMEGIGLVDGPRWPTVSVTPLGIYRDVPWPSGS